MTPDPDAFSLESEMDAEVRALFKTSKQLHYHTKDSKKSEAGFPDWVVVMSDATFFAEFKRSRRERASKEQIKWLTSMIAASMKMDVFLIKGKKMLDDFISVLGTDTTKTSLCYELHRESLTIIENDYNHWRRIDADVTHPAFENKLKMHNRRVIIK